MIYIFFAKLWTVLTRDFDVVRTVQRRVYYADSSNHFIKNVWKSVFHDYAENLSAILKLVMPIWMIHVNKKIESNFAQKIVFYEYDIDIFRRTCVSLSMQITREGIHL